MNVKTDAEKEQLLTDPKKLDAAQQAKAQQVSQLMNRKQSLPT
ncbi:MULTISPECIES: hypothetical protein [Symbiopectobacterium]|nr:MULTISPECIES: hypothetical protein [Symbiopectobacterium]